MPVKEPMQVWLTGIISVSDVSSFLDSVSSREAHDALAWKIAHVLRGWGSSKLLSTYEVERRAYAQSLIAFDKRLAKMMNEGDASKYDE
jgi:hypothetical protein